MIAVAALALTVLLFAAAVVGRAILAVAQDVFDVLLGEQHADDLVDWDVV